MDQIFWVAKLCENSLNVISYTFGNPLIDAHEFWTS